MLFYDRYDAALKLLPYLEKYKNEKGVVFAVPRGGVPIGYYIAKQFHLPLELLLTKKIGHPRSEEYAIGAVSLEDHFIDDRHDIPESYIETEVQKIKASLRERYKKFMGENHPPADVKNKTVIVVDDGIATGHTMLAAVRMLRKKEPAKIVVAVPVAPPETVQRLKKYVDELICLYSPQDFYGVAQFYVDFTQTTDEEVMQLLKESNTFGAAA